VPIIGQYIQRLTGLTQYSPPFPRGGQGALLSIDVFDVVGGTVRLDVSIEHKNEADTTWTNLGSFTAVIAVGGLKTLEVSSCKEMLRFAYSIAGGGSPQPYDAFHINVPAPTWRP
jgi:hypothetical protein